MKPISSLDSSMFVGPSSSGPRPAGRTLRELDCRDQQCPVPVLRLAKVASELREGGTISIRANDAAFPKDLRAWARSAGARITRFEQVGGSFEAVVAIGDEHPSWSDLELDPPEPPPLPVSQTFDLRGQPSAGLLDIVAKACDRAEPGAVLAFIVDDPEAARGAGSLHAPPELNFESQLEAWLRTADATLIAVDTRGSISEARIRVEPSISSRSGASRPIASRPVPSRASAPVSGRATEAFAGLAKPPQVEAVGSVRVRRDPDELARPAPRAESEPQRCTLLVLHNDHEALLAALLIANGAASQGMETSVFFTFWGLNLLRGQAPNLAAPEPPRIPLIQRLLKWMMPKGPERQPLGQMHFAGLGKGMLGAIMRRQQIMSLAELLAAAQELGVRFTACTMSMSVMGITARDLHPYPNLDFGGVASFVDDARRSSIQLVF